MRARDIAAAYAECFDTPAGGVVLADFWTSFVDRSSIVADDPLGTGFQEGQRDVFHRILQILPADARRRTMARIFRLDEPPAAEAAETEESV
jgi:hypothetical protein